jgi:hypothetical protein
LPVICIQQALSQTRTCHQTRRRDAHGGPP